MDAHYQELKARLAINDNFTAQEIAELKYDRQQERETVLYPLKILNRCEIRYGLNERCAVITRNVLAANSLKRAELMYRRFPKPVFCIDAFLDVTVGTILDGLASLDLTPDRDMPTHICHSALADVVRAGRRYEYARKPLIEQRIVRAIGQIPDEPEDDSIFYGSALNGNGYGETHFAPLDVKMQVELAVKHFAAMRLLDTFTAPVTTKADFLSAVDIFRPGFDECHLIFTLMDEFLVEMFTCADVIADPAARAYWMGRADEFLTLLVQDHLQGSARRYFLRCWREHGCAPWFDRGAEA